MLRTAALHPRRQGRRAAPSAAERSRLPSRFVALVLVAPALAGCAAGLASPPVHHLALPATTRALLTAPAQPDCTFHEIGLGDTVSDAAEVTRRRLAFERQCYRQAEMRMRARLRRLQAAVAAGMTPAASARCGPNR